MSYLRDRVIVLKKEPFREQDRRYWMYGKEHGLLSAVARGASVSLSKQAGHLEPFSESEVMIAKGAAFDKLAVAKRVSSGLETPMTLAGMAVCGAFADLVIRLTRPGISDEKIFYLLQELIQGTSHLSQELTPERARLLLGAAIVQLLDHLGFGPPVPSGAGAGTTPVPALALVSFMRRSPLVDTLRVTAPIEVLRGAASFIEEALEHTPLEQEPRGLQALRQFVG